MSEFSRNSNQSTLGELIEKLLRSYRLDGKMKELDIIAAWPELMGVAVANRTTALRIENHRLYVSLDSAVMRNELHNGKQIIIDRINAYAGKMVVMDIWFS